MLDLGFGKWISQTIIDQCLTNFFHESSDTEHFGFACLTAPFLGLLLL